MNRGITDVITISLLFISVYLIAGCHFDGSTKFCDSAGFQGCYERVSGFGEVKLDLETMCPGASLLNGTLIINQDSFRLFSVEGEQKSPVFALLNGTPNVDPGSNIPIKVFLVKGQENIMDDDTVSLQIMNEPPLGPLQRCEEN
jgi:hypothetical protein